MKLIRFALAFATAFVRWDGVKRLRPRSRKTVCAKCRVPFRERDIVALNEGGGPRPYVHFHCGKDSSRICGEWGPDDRLTPLSTMNPMYEGARTIGDHAKKSEQMTVIRFRRR